MDLAEEVLDQALVRRLTAAQQQDGGEISLWEYVIVS